MAAPEHNLYLDLDSTLPPYFLGLIRPSGTDPLPFTTKDTRTEPQQMIFTHQEIVGEVVIVDFPSLEQLQACRKEFEDKGYTVKPVNELTDYKFYMTVPSAAELSPDAAARIKEKFDKLAKFLYTGLSEQDARLMNFYLAGGEDSHDSIKDCFKETLEWETVSTAYRNRDDEFSITPLFVSTRLAEWLLRRTDLTSYEDIAFSKMMKDMEGLKPDCGLKQAAEAFGLNRLTPSSCFLSIKYPIRKTDVEWISEQLGYKNHTNSVGPEVPIKVYTSKVSAGVPALLKPERSLTLAPMPPDHYLLKKIEVKKTENDTAGMTSDVDLV